MSEEKEIALGQENDAEVRKEMGSYGDRALQEYVTSIGMKLAQVSERPNLPWHFTVADFWVWSRVLPRSLPFRASRRRNPIRLAHKAP